MPGGTSGLCFRSELGGRRIFLKTHGQSPAARAGLAKEIGILSYLEGVALDVRSCTMEDGRLWLIMNELVPVELLDPGTIRQIVTANSRKLHDYTDKEAIPQEDNLARLLHEGDRAFALLRDQKMLGGELTDGLPAYLGLLRQALPHMPPQLCHGDLGPRNLMTDGRDLFAIDWEDAFWGVEGYDYLYWLTFFENRRYHGPAMFGHTPWDKTVEIAIVLLVILIKCALSLRNGKHAGNQLSFDQRLGEIVALG